MAFICDDGLYLKDHPAARAHLPEAPLPRPIRAPGPILLAETVLDAPEPVCQALTALAAELPMPPPKPRKRT